MDCYTVIISVVSIVIIVIIILPPPPPPQILEGSGLLANGAGAFFYDKNLTLIDNLVDEEVRL